MTWLILAPERGVLRREPTHTRAVAWLLGLDDAVIKHQHTSGPGCYEYALGFLDEDHAETYFIIRSDQATSNGWDPTQPALYPTLTDPYEQVPHPDQEQYRCPDSCR